MKPRAEGRGRVFARYLLLQLPGGVAAAAVLAGLVHWDHLSSGIAYLLFGIWIAVEIALFPALRVAYEPGGGHTGVEAMVGALAVAESDLDPEGTVRLGSERWRALFDGSGDRVAAGTPVRVREVRDLTLVVAPARDDDGDAVRRPPARARS